MQDLKWPKTSIRSPAEPEAKPVELVAWVLSIPRADLQERRGEVPTTATPNPIPAVFSKTPFADISAHVIESQRVGATRAEVLYLCLMGRAFRHPAAAVPVFSIHSYRVIGCLTWLTGSIGIVIVVRCCSAG